MVYTLELSVLVFNRLILSTYCRHDPPITFCAEK
jgi:hypothetical protein